MRYRLLALDVDGTLLDPTGVVRPRVADAVRRAMTTGCRVVLATGRRLRSVMPIARELGIGTLILTDGTVVYDIDGERAIYERSLEAASLGVAVDLIVDAAIQPVLLESPAAGGAILTGPALFDNPETLSYLGNKLDVRRFAIPELPSRGRVVTVLALGDLARVERLSGAAKALDRFALTFWSPSTAGYHHHTLSFAPPGTSKGDALVWLADELGVSLAETMAVGDYENDVTLLQAAGLGVAMGNAVPSVLAAARATVADNANDGVAEAIERWVL
jgi:hydroxymethylpyrimidine pyrophosphatase-like HAD family hydrolase